jgi:hypothetical protein
LALEGLAQASLEALVDRPCQEGEVPLGDRPSLEEEVALGDHPYREEVVALADHPYLEEEVALGDLSFLEEVVAQALLAEVVVQESHSSNQVVAEALVAWFQETRGEAEVPVC